MSDQHVNAESIRDTLNTTAAIAAHLGLVLDQDGYTVTPPDGATLTEAVAHLLHARHTRDQFGTWDELSYTSRERWTDHAAAALADTPTAPVIAERLYNLLGARPHTSPWATLARGERARFTITAQHVHALAHAEQSVAPAAASPVMNESLRYVTQEYADLLKIEHPAASKLDGATAPGAEEAYPATPGEFAARWNAWTPERRTAWLADEVAAAAAAVRAAHLPTPAPDTRREDVARALHGANDGDGATCGVCLAKADAALPAPPVGGEGTGVRCQCGHLPSEHEQGAGCLAGWAWDEEGIATGPDGCRCQWAHVSSPTAAARLRGAARG